MTQPDLAAASGVDRVTISLIERGRRTPSLETLERLASGLGVEMADLFPKVEPTLFEAPDERGLTPPGAQAVAWREFEPRDWSVRAVSSPEIRRILKRVEAGQTTADEAASGLAEAITAMLKTRGHAPAT